MRFASTLVLALPALTFAEEAQKPLGEKVKGWFNKASTYVTEAASSIPSPLNAAAAKIASKRVSILTRDNWKQILVPSASASAATPDEWLIYFDGGNETCYGFCYNATAAWNESVAYLSTQKNPPFFGMVDCEKEPVFCNSWAVGPPSIYHMLLPKPLPDQSKPATTVRYLPLNRTYTPAQTAKNITDLITKEAYKNIEPYEGILHPFDGLLQKANIAMPLAYAFWGLSKLPTWAPMVIISLMSRFLMNRQMNTVPRRPAGATPGAAPAAAAPAPAPARGGRR